MGREAHSCERCQPTGQATTLPPGMAGFLPLFHILGTGKTELAGAEQHEYGDTPASPSFGFRCYWMHLYSQYPVIPVLLIHATHFSPLTIFERNSMLQQSFRLPEKSNVLFNIFWPVRVDTIKQENTPQNKENMSCDYWETIVIHWTQRGHMKSDMPQSNLISIYQTSGQAQGILWFRKSHSERTTILQLHKLFISLIVKTH